MIKNIMMTGVMMVLAGALVFGDSYTIDPVHSDVGFSVTHMTVSRVSGQFSDVSGTLIWSGRDELNQASFEGVVAVASIDTQHDKRDAHLKSKKVSKRFGKLYVIGDLTIRDVTKEVRFPITVAGPVKDPWGKTKIGVEGTLTIDRKDFGLTWNKQLDKGGVLI